MEKLEKLVYVASPLRAATAHEVDTNKQKAKRYMETLNNLFAECGIPYRAVAPHAYLPEILDDNCLMQRHLALEFGKNLLALCSALVVFSIDGISEGMQYEIEYAQHVPCFHVADETEVRFVVSEICRLHE